MAYVVRVSTRAQRDLENIYWFINAGESEAAQTWYRGLRRAILAFEELPNRWPVTPENPARRHILYGHKPHVYRVIYRVLERQKQVEILHIRHGAPDRS
jgi:plasmid stabilization system protein ParE